ncbi:MAG: hypothetical protein R3C68_01875 [Myxococcota bacterium]
MRSVVTNLNGLTSLNRFGAGAVHAIEQFANHRIESEFRRPIRGQTNSQPGDDADNSATTNINSSRVNPRCLGVVVFIMNSV